MNKYHIVILTLFCFSLLTSCEFDSQGNAHLTDFGYFVIIAFFFILIFGYLEKEKELKKEKEAREKRQIENEAFLKKLEEEKEAKRLEYEAVYKNIAEEYRSYSSLDIEVKGIFARSKIAKETVPILNVHDEIKFKKEPQNPYDEFAVKVMNERIHLGYIPAEISQSITELIDHKAIKKIVVKFAGDSKLYPWDNPDPYLILTIYYDNHIPNELKETLDKYSDS